MWRRPGGATATIGTGSAPAPAPASVSEGPRFVPAIAVGAVVVVVVAGIFVGTAAREDGFATGPSATVAGSPALVAAARLVWASAPEID